MPASHYPPPATGNTTTKGHRSTIHGRVAALHLASADRMPGAGTDADSGRITLN